ncbi:MAG TPA: GntR family transcriptional regulator [Thermomicrobiales bacterium]|jgi:GntR family transcriptional regulator
MTGTAMIASETAGESLVALLSDALKTPGRTPLYERIERAIGNAIQDGTLQPGTVFPSEPDLADRLGLSRQTINQALTGLARRGLLTRRRGVGTFVAEPVVEQPLGQLYSFIRTLTAQGHSPSTRLLGSRITQHDLASVLLTGNRDGLVFEVSRLRLVDGDPMVFEELYLPLACGESLPPDRLAHDVLYDLFAELCAVTVTHAEETLRPVTVARTEAALLGVHPGEPAFLVERTAYAGPTPVEFRRSLIRGDRYRFRVRLEGPALGDKPVG